MKNNDSVTKLCGMQRIAAALFFFLCCVGISWAQTTITGTVIDEFGDGLIGVNVVEKGTTNGTVTDFDGNYSLSVSNGSILVFSYIGYVPQEIATDGKQNINITLKEDSKQLEEAVVVGYQVARKADLTGAVSVIKLKETSDIPTSNPMEALQGRVPGVNITTDGSPEGAATVQIRGIGTLGNTDPLYVIDGMPTKRGLNELNSRDIESIQVLKDASSASIYGSRAANGVIIITTKRAKEGYKEISFNASLSTQFYTNRMNVLDANGLGRAVWQAWVNDGSDPNTSQSLYNYTWNNDYSSPVLSSIGVNQNAFSPYNETAGDTDWYDEVSRVPLIQSYNLTFSNGNEHGRSMFSIGYYNNEGIMKETFMKRLSVRANSEYNFFDDRLRVGENLSISYTDKDNQTVGGEGNASAVMWNVLRSHPLTPVYDNDGGWGGPVNGMSDVHNPLRQLVDNSENSTKNLRLFGNAFAEVKLTKDLTFRTLAGVDYYGTYYRNMTKSFSSGFLGDATNKLDQGFKFMGDWQWQNTLNYSTEFGSDHRLTVLLGHEMTKYDNQYFSGSRKGYSLENLDYMYLNTGSSSINNAGEGSSYTLLSFFGKADYQLMNKYLFSFTLRRDGSSRFAKDNRWGTFAAYSLGWRLSEEEFIRNLNLFSDLKLRYGWGQNGNQEIDNYAYMSIYKAIYGTPDSSVASNPDTGTAYDIAGNGSMVSGFARQQLGNKDLKWETTTQHNMGVDFGFLNNELTGSFDYFIKDTKDILISPNYLAVIGEGGKQWVNGASMKNWGWEMQLNYSHTINDDWNWNAGVNVSHYKNEVTKLPKNVLTSYPGNGTTDVILGRSINSIYGYVADGLFQNQAEVDAHATQTGAGPGRIRYKDLNNDNVIDDKDRTYLTDGLPKFEYGINLGLKWKDLSVSMFWQGLQGIDVYNNIKTLTDFTSLYTGTNYGDRVLDAWTPENTGSSIPMLTFNDANNEGRRSSYYVENGSYLKLRNIQVGYSLKKFCDKVNWISNADIYVQANNLLTIKSKDFTGVDPENSSNAYPRPMVTTIGLNVTF